jgi:tetratricopeptide (TPR) repeat protein
MEAGELGQSHEIFVRLIESHPDMSQAYNGFGSVLARQGESRLAMQSYERAIELSPRYAPAHYGLALIYRQQDNPEAAEHHFSLHEKYKQDRSYAYDPMLAKVGLLNQSDQLPMQRGKQFVAQGRVEAAIDQFVMATERNPNNAAAHATLVGLYGYLGQMEPAQAHYYLAVSLDPSQAKLHFNWGAALAKSGRYIEAAEAFVQTLEIDPQDANAHWQLGFSLENQGDNAAALAQYRLAVDDNPKHKEAHYLLGRQLANLGEYTEAVMHIEQSLAPAHPRTPLFLRGLVEIYAEMGNTQLAAETLERAKRSAEKWNTPPLSQSQ